MYLAQWLIKSKYFINVLLFLPFSFFEAPAGPGLLFISSINHTIWLQWAFKMQWNWAGARGDSALAIVVWHFITLNTLWKAERLMIWLVSSSVTYPNPCKGIWWFPYLYEVYFIEILFSLSQLSPTLKELDNWIVVHTCVWLLYIHGGETGQWLRGGWNIIKEGQFIFLTI